MPRRPRPSSLVPTKSNPRGFALLVVVLAVAVGTGLLVRALYPRGGDATPTTPLIQHHLQTAVLARCVDAFDLLDPEPRESPPTAPTQFPVRVSVDGGTCVIERTVGSSATVFEVRTLDQIVGTDASIQIVRTDDRRYVLVRDDHGRKDVVPSPRD